MEVLVWGCWCRAGEGRVIAAGGGGGGSKVPWNLACMCACTLAYTLWFWAELCINLPQSRACSRCKGGVRTDGCCCHGGTSGGGDRGVGAGLVLVGGSGGSGSTAAVASGVVMVVVVSRWGLHRS